jgi:hypothetical protein
MACYTVFCIEPAIFSRQLALLPALGGAILVHRWYKRRVSKEHEEGWYNNDGGGAGEVQDYQAEVRISVLRAVNLPALDTFSSDPYVKINYCPDGNDNAQCDGGDNFQIQYPVGGKLSDTGTSPMPKRCRGSRSEGDGVGGSFAAEADPLGQGKGNGKGKNQSKWIPMAKTHIVHENLNPTWNLSTCRPENQVSEFLHSTRLARAWPTVGPYSTEVLVRIPSV